MSTGWSRTRRLPAVDGAVRRAEVADEDLPLAQVDRGVELGDVGPIDLQIVELVAADAHREALERRLELLVGLGVEHLGHERHRHGGEPSRPSFRFGRGSCPAHLCSGRRRAARPGRGAVGERGAELLSGSATWWDLIPHDEPGSEDPSHGLGPGVRLRRRDGRARVDDLVGAAAVVARHEAPRGGARRGGRAPRRRPSPRVTRGRDRRRRVAGARPGCATSRRARRRREGGEACDLDRPTFSKAPRYESRTDRDVVRPRRPRHGRRRGALQAPAPRPARPGHAAHLKYVRFFTRTERGRGMFETWLKRSGRYQEMIQTELRERRLPEDLMWVAMIESGFDPRAKSPAGAVGLWQFMPATGDVYGLAAEPLPRPAEEPAPRDRRPRRTTCATSTCRFGSWDLALAAYNMGYEQLLDAIDKYGTADFNELARQQAIPTETAAYVPKIAAAAIVANNLEHFGFDKVERGAPGRRRRDRRAAGHAAEDPRQGRRRGHLRGALAEPRHPRRARARPGAATTSSSCPRTRSRARAPRCPRCSRTSRWSATTPPCSIGSTLLQGRELFRRRVKRDDESLLSLLPHPRRHGACATRSTTRTAPARATTTTTRRALRRQRRRRPAPLPRPPHAPPPRDGGVPRRPRRHDPRRGAGSSGSTPRTSPTRTSSTTATSSRSAALLKLKVRRDLVDDLSAGEKDAKAGTTRRPTGAPPAHEAPARGRSATRPDPCPGAAPASLTARPAAGPTASPSG